FDAAGSRATLAGTFGLKRVPPQISHSAGIGSESDPLCLTAVAARNEPVLIEDIGELFRSSLRRENLIPQQAIAIPVPRAASKGLAAILVAGLNPMRPVAESREFLLLVAGQLETAIASASARHDSEE